MTLKRELQLNVTDKTANIAKLTGAAVCNDKR